MKPFCFSLSGIYESEGYAWEQAGKIWDLRELRGTDGYLDPETEQFLEAERKSCRGSAFWIPAIITI